MEIPKIVYHGTFWPKGESLSLDRLKTGAGYICTSSRYDWAHYFGLSRRQRYRERSGSLMVYGIDTGLLPEEVSSNCIPPDGMDPRASTRDWLREYEDRMRPGRVKIGEWRFPHIPLSAVVSQDEQYFEPNPTMTLLDVAICEPRY